MTDPIADMVTRIRNAVHARHPRVDVPASRFKVEIARILEQEGYIHGFRIVDAAGESRADRAAAGAAGGEAGPPAVPRGEGPSGSRSVIRILLKYGPRGEKVISGLERVSRPGRRVYLGRDDVPKIMGGLGTSILTTSRGVMTGRDAVKAGVGGEVLCNVW
jgi:small subunit ribosomal protein S8